MLSLFCPFQNGSLYRGDIGNVFKKRLQQTVVNEIDCLWKCWDYLFSGVSVNTDSNWPCCHGE